MVSAEAALPLATRSPTRELAQQTETEAGGVFIFFLFLVLEGGVFLCHFPWPWGLYGIHNGFTDSQWIHRFYDGLWEVWSVPDGHMGGNVPQFRIDPRSINWEPKASDSLDWGPSGTRKTPCSFQEPNHPEA